MANLAVVERLPCRAASTAAFVVVSAAMQSIVRLAERAAPTRVPVLLLGETGTGKDVLARHVHAQSGRRGEFVALNCAALPSTLAESELFGHERGAFTGADRLHKGAFEQAHGGTLLLDEIGDLDLTVQGKLLRVLEDGIVRRLGSTRTFAVDVRIIAATHRDLYAAVEAGRFREDLLHRLAGISLDVPALRARRDEIPALAERFIADEGGDGAARTIAPETIQWLASQPWRGNVRELRQAVRRACALGGTELRPEDFGLAPDRTSAASLPALSEDEPTEMRWAEIEREVIARAIRRHGSVRAAARALGRPKSSLADRARALGLSSQRVHQP